MEDFKERIIFTFLEHKRAFLAGIFCFAGLAVLGVYFQTAPGPEAYAQAEEAVAKWKEKDDDASYNEMRKALKKVPSLEKKHSGAIAQKLFQKNRLSEALTLAHRSMNALDEAPFHAAYSETSLLIEREGYQNALEQSVGLRENMLKNCDLNQEVGGHSVGGGLLFAHNLLRIACLQQELANRPGEKAAWEDLEKFLGTRASLQRLVFENFRDKSLDLSHYIIQRKKQL